jgi:hypothetical protein
MSNTPTDRSTTMSTLPPPAANDPDYDGPDDDLASGNITDADFARQNGLPPEASEDPASADRETNRG